MSHRFSRTFLSLIALSLGVLSFQVSFGDEAVDQLMLATHKLDGQSSTAGGTVFHYETEDQQKRRFVLTADHVLSQMKGNSCLLVSRKLRDNGEYGRMEIRIPIREGGKPIWRKHKAHDLAILPLPPIANVHSLPIDCLATEDTAAQMHAGDDVRIGVFPERAESNNAGFPILRGGFIASFPIAPIRPHSAFMIDTTSWTGDSGGPVMHQTLRSPNGGPLVVGVIRGKRSVTDTTRESRFVEKRTHYSLGISEALHAALAWDVIPEEWVDKP